MARGSVNCPAGDGGDGALAGGVANPVQPPSGCYFHPHCPFVVVRCLTEPPARREVNGALVRCHRAEELNLAGT